MKLTEGRFEISRYDSVRDLNEINLSVVNHMARQGEWPFFMFYLLYKKSNSDYVFSLPVSKDGEMFNICERVTRKGDQKDD